MLKSQSDTFQNKDITRTSEFKRDVAYGQDCDDTEYRDYKGSPAWKGYGGWLSECDSIRSVNIDRELDFLTDIYNEINNEKKLDSFLNKLLEVNQKLWEIEDEIRVLERKKQFDEDFILLARSVYIENDKRFEIKNEINNFLGSAIKEEKLYEDYN